MEHVWGYTIVNDVTARDLQRDHRQWLLGPHATIWFGTGDWDHFVEGPPGAMLDHIRHGLLATAGRGDRLRLVDRDTTVAPGVTLTMTPGHTPGHLCVVVSSAGQRALLLGDR